MLKDNTFVKSWAHKLDPEPHLEGLISEAGWQLLQNKLTEKTYNAVITELEGELNNKKDEINQQIDNTIANLQSKKMK